jgi:uncharacterized protein (TIRG00374 family)
VWLIVSILTHHRRDAGPSSDGVPERSRCAATMPDPSETKGPIPSQTEGTQLATPSRPRHRLWRHVQWGLALLLAGLAAWLSVRQIHWPTLMSTLVGTDLPLLAGALGTVLATTLVKAARWHVLLRLCAARTSGIRVLRVLLIGQMGNILLPARLGDVGRAVLVGPQATGGIPAVLGTILVEKTLDGAMGLLVLIGLVLWMPMPSWLYGPIVGISALVGGLLVLLVLATVPATAHPLVSWLPARLQPAQGRLGRLLAGLKLGLGLFRQPANALLALALSIAVWGLAALTNVVTFAALDISAPAWSIWLVLVIGYLANSLPTVPAQVGVFEYTHMLALTVAGVSQEPALAYSLILHLLVHGPPAILGPVSMIWEGMDWAKLKDARL